MAGIVNDTVFGVNVDFSGQATPAPTLLTDGQMLIGTTTPNAGGTHINVGTITSTGGTITITYVNPMAGVTNINLETVAGAASVLTLSDDVGTTITPLAGNIQLVGHVVEQGATKFSTVLAGTHLANINPMSSYRWIVDPLGFNGTHTTLSSAITSATSGDTIKILAGSILTENPTLKAGVNIVADVGDADTPNVTIIGKCTFTGAGTVSISGIRLQTNSDFALAVTGSSASVVILKDCYLNFTNNTGISFTSSSASSEIAAYNTNGNLGTTGIAPFASSSAGLLFFQTSVFTNTGLSTARSTISAGTLEMLDCIWVSGISSSGTAAVALERVNCGDQTLNIGALVIGGSGAGGGQANFCTFQGGTSSAISISTAFTLRNVVIQSTNTNAVTGVGQLNYGNLTFSPGSSTTVNTTTQTSLVTDPGAVRMTTPSSYPYSAVATDGIILVDSSSARTINLPASASLGQQTTVQDAGGAAGINNISVFGVGFAINGFIPAFPNVINTAYGCRTYTFNGTMWNVTSQF